MNTHLAAFATGLSDPPKAVDPITVWGQIGHSVLLALGLVILSGAGAVWRRSASGALMLGTLGAATTWQAETRFLRAVHPESTWLFREAVLVFLLATAAVALAGRSLLRSADLAVSVLVGGLTALGLAVAADHFYEHLASIPMALGTLLAAGAILFVVTKDRFR